MRLSIKEKAGIVDVSKIFEGLHLSKRFIENTADEKKKGELDSEIIKEGERHFSVCDKCRNTLKKFEKGPKEQDLLS